MKTAQAPPPRKGTSDASTHRSLRAPLILALAALGTVVLLMQPIGMANLFPSRPAPAAPPPPPPIAAAPATTPPAAPAAVAAVPRYGTGLNFVPLSNRPIPARLPSLPDGSPDISSKPAADATPDAPPPERDALPLQTTVVGGQGSPRLGGGVSARPATGGSGSSTRPGAADPNG